MNNDFNAAHTFVQKAREALRLGQLDAASQLAQQAARLAPQSEDAWLVMAATAANPRDSLAYLKKALEINPQSARAHKGLQWAKGRLKESANFDGSVDGLLLKPTMVSSPVLESKPAETTERGRFYPVLLVILGCLVVGLALWSAARNPALASIMSGVSAATPTHENVWAPVDIEKPTFTPTPTEVFTPTPSDTPTPLPTDTPTVTPTDTATFTPEPTETPGTMALEIIPDTPTSVYVPPTSAPNSPPVQYASSGNGARWIDVNLSQQRVYAYEGDVVVNSFVVSTGTWRTPTVTGKYKIYIRQRYDNMGGPGYYLPDVPYVMYFHKGYALHGTYWHNNFGTPMSHGCVNLSIPDAAWLYNWASMGMTVKVHY